MATKSDTTKEKKTTKAAAPKKTAAKTTAIKKPKAVKEDETPVVEAVVVEQQQTVVEPAVVGATLNLSDGRYAYAVGRRKTSVANVRLFLGKGKHEINKKDIKTYFGSQAFIDAALRPLQLLGLNEAFIYVNTNGGGTHSQAQAIAHGISLAVAKNNPELRKVLKKNGLLTRDSRMKERKKPGLKRARRGPQWAKR
jgi:small subunit ribosomal protein S9